MPQDMDTLCDDLLAETADLLAVVEPLDDASWSTLTPAGGWDVRDTVAHLAFFDDRARQALVDPEGFRAERDAMLSEAGFDMVDRIVQDGRRQGPADTLAGFRSSRAELIRSARPLDPSSRTPWYGPDMSAASSITARIMETWAHGQDVVDALGLRRESTDRLRHVAFIGARTVANSYQARGRPVPAVPVRVELVAPSGETWAFGPADAADIVRGPAVDFCLLVTQRRHRDDLALSAEGPVAIEWMTIAQAFAGPPGPGRKAGQFAS